ncbi:maltose alpha-D-glucosyltransferase [Candidatus Leptofilum sp.]|uniref:maltose alpha-D-glucosyltransferase n=1 Tax=Candidatus Leptofilum sp. TaxID=3241576 RepID=UPI003B5AE3F9
MNNEPFWYKTAVFYELYIRAYQDSTGDGHGDFRGAIQHLDHIQSLGVDCIWIMPHYASPLKDDGYDIADYYQVHPDYGTLEDFKAFLDAAHARGLKVVTDLVTNHTSDQHPWFQAARQDKNSPYRDYYVWSDTGTEYSDARIIFLDTEASNWTYDDVAGQYFWHRFYSSQPDLNYDNPQVHEEMFNVIRHWLDMGLDGFRVDAIPYLYEREGTNCENLPETHAFLQKMRRMVDTEYPGRVLIAEANQWPEDLLPYFGTEENPEFQICFHFPIMPRLYQAVKSGDKTPIEEIWARTPDIPKNAQWMTFLRNHDELTLEMVTPEVRQWMWDNYAPDPRMKLNLGIRRRLAPLLDDNKAKWFLLHTLFLSLPGTPIVYYGDEIGMGDNIWLPDRHGCRTPMQWNSEKNGGFSNAAETYFPIHTDPVYGYQTRNVAVQEKDSTSYLNLMRFLLKARQSVPAFGDGVFEFVGTGSRSVMAYTRSIPNQTVLCLFNLSDQPQNAHLNLPDTFTDLLAANPAMQYQLAPDGQALKIAPFAAHWFL